MSEVFEEHRQRLFGIAYRMTGSAADAEDLVQEAYLRWQGAARDEVRSPREYLTATVTRLSIDFLRSARVRREEYVGPWLPEPLADESARDPVEALTLAESLRTAFLLLLETLSPGERAAFLLREVFDYEYADLARVLGKSEAACRQAVRRARQRIAERRPRFSSSSEQLEQITERFARACADGDPDALLALLSEGVVYVADGGGKVPAALRPVLGAANVGRLMLGLAGKLPPGMRWNIQRVNGQPAVVGSVEGKPHSVITLAVAEGRIEAIYVVSNPEKLGRLGATRT